MISGEMQFHSGQRLATVSLCCLAWAIAADPPQNWQSQETFTYRQLEGGCERRFTLEYLPDDTMPTAYRRLRIQTPGQRDFELINSDAWWIHYQEFEFKTWFSGRQNVLNSKYIFGLHAKFDGRLHTLVFLIGWPFASSPGSLHVIDLEESRPPTVLLEKEELELLDVRDLDGDGNPEILGLPCMTHSADGEILSYAPFHVYARPRGGGAAELSLPLSRTYNERHSYGWAGPDCSFDLAIVLHPLHGHKPIIVQESEAKKFARPPNKKSRSAKSWRR